MEIINQGKHNVKYTPKDNNKIEIFCDHCWCKFRVDIEKDKSNKDGLNYYTCPNCGKPHYYEKNFILNLICGFKNWNLDDGI